MPGGGVWKVVGYQGREVHAGVSAPWRGHLLTGNMIGADTQQGYVGGRLQHLQVREQPQRAALQGRGEAVLAVGHARQHRRAAPNPRSVGIDIGCIYMNIVLAWQVAIPALPRRKQRRWQGSTFSYYSETAWWQTQPVLIVRMNLAGFA